MASVTVFFKRRLQLSIRLSIKTSERSWDQSKGAKSRMYWKFTVFPSFWYQTCNTFFDNRLERDCRGKSKRDGKVFCRSYRIFGPDSFLSISTYPRNFATKRNFKTLTETPWFLLSWFGFLFSVFYELILRMPRRKNTRFNVAQFIKAWKVAREKAVSENRKPQAEYKIVQRTQEKVRWYI